MTNSKLKTNWDIFTFLSKKKLYFYSQGENWLTEIRGHHLLRNQHDDFVYASVHQLVPLGGGQFNSFTRLNGATTHSFPLKEVKMPFPLEMREFFPVIFQ